MPLRKILLCLIPLLIAVNVAIAQDEEPVPTEVTVTAADNLALIGDYYAPATEDPAPSVLLLHQNGGRRQDWEPLVAPLLVAGYHVLTVDMRGFGETGGTRNWEVALTDVQTWLDWLRAQPGVRSDAVSIIGASIGSNLALVGCAADPQCVTAIALSPGLDYFGVQPAEAINEGLAERSALLIAARDDDQSANSVVELAANAPGEIGVRLYTGGLHGTGLFIVSRYSDSVIALIISWLEEHLPEIA